EPCDLCPCLRHRSARRSGIEPGVAKRRRCSSRRVRRHARDRERDRGRARRSAGMVRRRTGVSAPGRYRAAGTSRANVGRKAQRQETSLMAIYADRVRDAVLAGDWPSVFREATAWVEDISRGPEGGSLRDPRAHFALNVVHLIKGEFGKAWKLSATSLQEASDIEQVRDWTEAILAQHLENANVQLVMGLFLAQSGQSERSVDRYKDAIRLDRHSPYPHYFLSQFHERANRMEMAIKEFREAVKLNLYYAPARTN